MPRLRLFRYTMVSCGLVMVLGGVVVGGRLVAFHFRNAVVWGTLWPLFASGLASVFELALILGVPLGIAWSLGTAVAGTRTETAGSPVTEPHWLSKCAAFAVLWFAASSAVGAYANLRLTTPGRVARGVVEGAREVCDDAERIGTVPVPMIGARWVCGPSAPPRLVGELTQRGSVTKYSARDIAVSEDLAYVDLTELDLSAPALRDRPSLHVAVQAARFRGALPWAKPKRLPGAVRALYVAGLASVIGFFVAVLMLQCLGASRWLGGSVATIGGVAAWMLFGVVDSHSDWSILSYVAVPMGSALSMFAATLAFRLLTRVPAPTIANIGWRRMLGPIQRRRR